MKKLLAFVALMSFVSVLAVGTVGCGSKKATTSAGAMGSTEKVTVTTEKK